MRNSRGMNLNFEFHWRHLLSLHSVKCVQYCLFFSFCTLKVGLCFRWLMSFQFKKRTLIYTSWITPLKANLPDTSKYYPSSNILQYFNIGSVKSHRHTLPSPVTLVILLDTSKQIKLLNQLPKSEPRPQNCYETKLRIIVSEGVQCEMFTRYIIDLEMSLKLYLCQCVTHEVSYRETKSE